MAESVLTDVIPKERFDQAVQNLVNSKYFVLKEIEIEPATKEISGFMGAHWRVKISVHVNGKDFWYRLFIKTYPQQESQRAAVIKLGAFRREVNFYNQILPALLQQGIPLSYPKCYLAHSDGLNDCLLLQDLYPSSYRRFGKLRKGLDFAHCALVLQELAKLHGASVALEKRKGMPLNQVYPFLTEVMFTEKCVKLICDGFKSSSETILELAKLISKHKDLVPKFEKKMSTLHDEGCKLVRPWNVLNVVCHGDVWTNNVLFKYDESGNPVDVMLLDLQFARYGPPTLDIIVFLYVSTTRPFREKYRAELLRIYHKSFTGTLEKVGLRIEGFTLKALEKNFLSKRLLGITYAFWSLPFILLEEEQLTKATDPDIPDEFESLSKGKMTTIAIQTFIKDLEYRARLTEVIDEFFEVFVIKCCNTFDTQTIRRKQASAP